MAWNEQYARILEQMKKNSATSTSISGADTKNDEPDCLFYTNFSRETAEAFYDIFEKFKGYYRQNPSIAIDTLKNNLKKQIEGMEDICPIEVMLYASRTIRDYLAQRQIKQALISIIQQYIPGNLKSVQYILSGWEWPQILAIVIEACGKTNNDYAIKMAMDYCPKIAKKFVDKNDNELRKSYIPMIENTQHENYLGYITQIVCLPQFEDDNVLVDYFVKELRRNTFLKDYKEQIATNIHPKTSSFSLKRSLEKIMDSARTPAGANDFSMGGLNYAAKVKRVEALDFTRNTSAMLADFERSREADNEIVLLTCKKILKSFYAMRSNDRNLALVLVGTKGSRANGASLVEDILDVQEVYPETKVATLLALSELDARNFPLEDAIDAIIVNPDIDQWDWAVGKYFRFRKALFEKNLLRAFRESIADSDIDDVGTLLIRLQKLILLFDGNNQLLSSQIAVQNNILDIIDDVIEMDINERVFSQILEILNYLLSLAPLRVLSLLDKLKVIAERYGWIQLIKLVNEAIKKGDLAREPD